MSRRRQRGRRFWRRVRSLCWTAVFLLIVGAAVLTGLGRLLAPYADRLTPHLSDYLSTQLETRVSIGEVSAGWQGAQPHLALSNVVIGDSDEALELQQVRLQFDPLTWFRPQRNSIRMEILRADLSLTRSSGGDWRLMGQGLDSQSGSNPGQLQTITGLLRRADVQLVDARIRLLDQSSEYQRVFDLPRVSVAQVPVRQDEAGTSGSDQPAGSRFQMIARLQPDGDEQAEAALRLIVQAGDELQLLQGYLQTRQQALQPWLSLIPEASAAIIQNPAEGEAELWFDWAQGAGLRLTGHVQLSGEFADGADTERAEPVFMAADVLARYADSGDEGHQWAVNLENLAFSRASLGGSWLELGSNAGGGWSLAAGPLPLRPLQSWQQWMQPDSRPGIGLFGELQELTLAMDDQGRVLNAVVSSDGVYLDAKHPEYQAPADADGREPVLCGPLQLKLDMHQQFGLLSVDSETGVCEIPGITREPYLLEQLRIQMQLEQIDAGWLAHWQPSHWDSGDFRLTLGGRAGWMQDRLWLDMHTGIDAILATQVQRYLPYQEQPRGAREWIARSMQGGYWRDIRASLHGFPADEPLTPEQGSFQASVRLDQAEVHYGRNWPPATGVKAKIDMRGTRIYTRNAQAAVSGVPVSDLDISIDDLSGEQHLDMTATLDTRTAAVLDLLGEMPLRGTGGLRERDFELDGPVQINAALGLDLRNRSRLIYADGRAQLQDVKAYAGLLEVDAINGELGFDGDGVTDSTLQAEWGGHASQVRWQRTAAGPEIHLLGRYPAAHVTAVALPSEPLARQLLAGDSDWLLRLLISRPTPRAILSSDLLGTEVRLPAPLDKFAPVSQPLLVDWELGEGERNIAIDYAGRLQLRMLQNTERIISGASARFQSPVRALPIPRVTPGKVLLTGQPEVFDPLGWIGLAAGLAGGDGTDSMAADALTPEMHLQTPQLLVDRRAMGSTRLDYTQRMAPGIDGDMAMQRVLSLDGDNVSGDVSFSINDHNWVIDTNLQRLNIPRPLISSSQRSGRERLSEDRPPADDAERIDWLTLHLICDDMTWHGLPLGQTRIEVLPRVDGMVIDTLEARSDILTLTGSGGWRRTEDGVNSNLNLRLDADNTGDVLASMGYERLVEGSQLTLMLESSWPGSIGELNLRKMDAKLTLEAGAGVIPKAAPGAGRVLGLISLQALPRRLFLDFSDVFAEGLDFDRAGGILIFHAGVARTSGIVIDAAAAEITITGETDLIRGEYDQLISVKPGVGVALPILGAIAGGPIGVGAGFALQGILGSSLGGLAEIQYAVTGPWDSPELRALADQPTVNQQAAGELPAAPLPSPPEFDGIDDSNDDTDEPQDDT